MIRFYIIQWCSWLLLDLGHDGTLACGLSTLGLWTVKFSTSLPDSLLTFFKVHTCSIFMIPYTCRCDCCEILTRNVLVKAQSVQKQHF